jgi:hypothetical protein
MVDYLAAWIMNPRQLHQQYLMRWSNTTDSQRRLAGGRAGRR